MIGGQSRVFFTPWAALNSSTPHQQRHPCMTEESQFAVDSLEGADGVIIKWRGEMLLLLCDHLAVGDMGGSWITTST